MATTGIQFLTNDRGERVAVQIDIRRHRLLWEELADTLVAEGRRKEKSTSLADVKASLVKRGRPVADFAVRFKVSALKELEALEDRIIQRIFPRIESLSVLPRPQGSKKLRGAKRSFGEFESEIIASSIPFTMNDEL